MNDILQIHREFLQVEETWPRDGADADVRPLRKVAACLVFKNPFAGRQHVADLTPLIESSDQIGRRLGEHVSRLLGQPAESYGKAGLVGALGAQEHVNAALTSVFGDAFRSAIGGGKAWISSVTKPAVAGAIVDVPLAYKDDVWVRSHYDAMEVRVPDAPHPDELVIIAAAANRGRIFARVGGRTKAESLELGE